MTGEKLAEHFKLECLRQSIKSHKDFIDKAIDVVNTLENELEAHLKKNNLDINSLSEKWYEKNFYKKNQYEMLIISNYKLVELVLKDLLIIKSPHEESRIRKYDKKCLECRFEELIPNFKKIQYHSSFNELNELNNSIKHNGIASKNLKKDGNLRWQKGAEIEIEEADINHFYEKTSKFLLSVIDEIRNV